MISQLANMRLRQIATVLSLCFSAAQAFRDSSPFFLFSNSDLFRLKDPFPSIPFAKSSRITQSLIDTFAECPLDAYILVSQPGAQVSDYENNEAIAYMERKMTGVDGRVLATQALTDVVGEVDIDAVQRYLVEKCGASLVGDHQSDGFAESGAPLPWIYKVKFDALPEQHSERNDILSKHDSYLHALASSFYQRNYVVVYSTTPPSTLPSPKQKKPQEQHAMTTFDFEWEDSCYGTLHTDMKRGEAITEERQANNDTDARRNAAIFEKYNFFTPAIFVGLFASVILMAILYVALSAISSVEVSYAAFNKEMGPQGQQAQRSKPQ